MTSKQERLKLYELPEAFRAIDSALDESGGELTDEIAARLDSLESTLTHKVDAISALIFERLRHADAIGAEIERLAARKAVLRNEAERLKAYLKDSLKRIGETKIKGDLFMVTVCDNPSTSIKWVGDGEPPKRFCNTTVAFSSERVREWLAAHPNKAVPEGIEITRGDHARIR